MENNDAENWSDLQEQLRRIISSTDVDADESYLKEIESLFGIDFENLNDGISKYFYTKQIKVIKTHAESILPKYAYKHDSGFDLFSVEKYVIPPFGRALVSTGIKISFPEGYEVQIRPKSGLALNMGITVLNTPGTIDYGYTGEIQIIVFNTNSNSVIIEKGMKVAQGVLCPVVYGKNVDFVEVESFEDMDRGINGFGSTGLV